MQAQHNIEQTVATVTSASGAGVGVTAYLQQANEILVFVATVIAIVSGAWALWDRYQDKKGEKSNDEDQGTKRD